MKKYLLTGMAAMMFCGVFTSCSRDTDFGQTKQQQIQETYEEAFISRFGNPSPNQDWGFGSQTTAQARTRAVVDNPTVTLIGNSFNKTLADMSDLLATAISSGTNVDAYFSNFTKYTSWWGSKWNDQFYQINGTVIDSDLSDDYLAQARNIILREIPEGKDNRYKTTETNYTITTKGGPVTLTPIYHNSNSGDKISYYYYPANTTPTVDEIKAMKKYTIGNMADPQVCNTDNYSFYRKTFYLVYDGPDGPTHEFPAGLKINFIISNTWVGNGNLTIYNSGGITVSDEEPTPDPTPDPEPTPDPTPDPTPTSELVAGTQIFKYSVPENKSYFCGEYAYRNGDGPYSTQFVRIGNNGLYDYQWAQKNDSYNDFGISSRNSIDGYSYYTPGNEVNGSLEPGSTVYYFKFTYNNDDGLGRSADEFMARVGIKINGTKSLYVYELDSPSSTSGNPVINGQYYPETFNGVIEFRINQGKTYAIYASGSKLGFYGCEVLYENSKRQSARSNTRGSYVTDIVTAELPNNPEYYGDGRLNESIHNSGITQWNKPDNLDEFKSTTSHVAIFSLGDKNYVGFEDWKDFDYNDVIFEVTGTEGGTTITEELDEWDEIRVIAEDLSVGQNTDFDFNDIVYDVRRYKKDTQTKHKNGDVEIILRAAGGTLPLYILAYDDDHEVHHLFNVDQYTMVNTNAKARGMKGKDDAAPVTITVTSEQLAALGISSPATAEIGVIARAIPVWVYKNEEKILLDAPDPAVGIASKFGVRIAADGYQWCEEREDIDHKYTIQQDGTSLFTEWVQGFYPNNDWWKYAKKSITEYRAAKEAANNSTNP